LEKFVEKRSVEFQEGQGVDLLICERTEIGYKTIIDNSRWGMLYRNEVFQTLRKGEHLPVLSKRCGMTGR